MNAMLVGAAESADNTVAPLYVAPPLRLSPPVATVNSPVPLKAPV